MAKSLRNARLHPGKCVIARNHDTPPSADIIATNLGKLQPGQLHRWLWLEARNQAFNQAQPILGWQAEYLNLEVFHISRHCHLTGTRRNACRRGVVALAMAQIHAGTSLRVVTLDRESQV